jgi:hypothetical protein
MRRHFIKYIYSGIFGISFFLCLKISIPSPAESIDTLDSEIIKKYQNHKDTKNRLAMLYIQSGRLNDATSERNFKAYVIVERDFVWSAQSNDLSRLRRLKR